MNPNEYNQEFLYYPVSFNLIECVESCITLNDLSNKVYARNKIEDLNLSVFNMFTGINEAKHI